MSSYRIIKKTNLIVQYFSGNVSISAVKVHIERLSLDPDYSKNYDTVVDLRDAIFDKTEVYNVNEFVDYVSNELNAIGKRKTIYLTSKPNEVVLTTLLSNEFKNTEIEFHVCSTEDAAIKFLNNSDLNKSILKNLIDELKNTA